MWHGQACHLRFLRLVAFWQNCCSASSRNCTLGSARAGRWGWQCWVAFRGDRGLGTCYEVLRHVGITEILFGARCPAAAVWKADSAGEVRVMDTRCHASA